VKYTVLQDEDIKRNKWVEMAEPDRVRVSYGVTHNLGDFNGVRMDVSWETTVLEDETQGDAIARAFDEVEHIVEQKLEEYAVD
jgi:hypothetical protein